MDKWVWSRVLLTILWVPDPVSSCLPDAAVEKSHDIWIFLTSCPHSASSTNGPLTCLLIDQELGILLHFYPFSQPLHSIYQYILRIGSPEDIAYQNISLFKHRYTPAKGPWSPIWTKVRISYISFLWLLLRSISRVISLMVTVMPPRRVKVVIILLDFPQALASVSKLFITTYRPCII